jgi:hypothetical protein
MSSPRWRTQSNYELLYIQCNLCNFRRDHKRKFHLIIFRPPPRLCGGNCTALVLIDRRLFLRRSRGNRLRSVCYRRLKKPALFIHLKLCACYGFLVKNLKIILQTLLFCAQKFARVGSSEVVVADSFQVSSSFLLLFQNSSCSYSELHFA